MSYNFPGRAKATSNPAVGSQVATRNQILQFPKIQASFIQFDWFLKTDKTQNARVTYSEAPVTPGQPYWQVPDQYSFYAEILEFDEMIKQACTHIVSDADLRAYVNTLKLQYNPSDIVGGLVGIEQVGSRKVKKFYVPEAFFIIDLVQCKAFIHVGSHVTVIDLDIDAPHEGKDLAYNQKNGWNLKRGLYNPYQLKHAGWLTKLLRDRRLNQLGQP